MNALYPSMLRLYYGINSNLKKEGILAPFAASVLNTKRLYDLIGQPLDNIPTIHIGGTNGKVSFHQNNPSLKYTDDILITQIGNISFQSVRMFETEWN